MACGGKGDREGNGRSGGKKDVVKERVLMGRKEVRTENKRTKKDKQKC